MDIDDFIKLILFVAFFVLPPILKAKEQGRNQRPGSKPNRNPQKRPAPKTGQTLSEWMEEVRRASERSKEEEPEVVKPIDPPPIRERQTAQAPAPREQQKSRNISPVQAHVSPVEVDIKAHVRPVKVDIQAHVDPIRSRFGSIDELEPTSDDKRARDHARLAKGAKRAKRAGGRTVRARRSSGRRKAGIQVRLSEMKRAMVLQELLMPPIALREDQDRL